MMVIRLQFTASKRSLRNKAELVTSGLARDIRQIQRTDLNTDLKALAQQGERMSA